MANQLLVSPTGTLVSVPDDQLADALSPDKGGFSPLPPPTPDMTFGVSPSGVLTALPLDQAKDAFDPTKGGFKTLDYHTKVLNETNRQRPIYDSTFGAAGGLDKELSKVVDDVHADHKDDDIFGANADNSKTFKMQLRGIPKDVPLGQVENYMNQGYEFKDQNFQALVDAHVQLQKEHKAGSIGSTLINKAATLFGKGDEGGIEGAIGDRNLLANYVAEHYMYKEHPVAKVAGELVSAATDPIPGKAGLGREAEQAIVGESKALPKQIAGFVANHAIEGARVMYPQAAVTAVVDKDPKLAAEQLLLGAGLSVGLGGAFKGAGALLGKAEKPIVSEIDQLISKEAGGIEKEGAAGRAEIENAFRKTLIESGVGEKSTEKQVSAILKDIAEGKHLAPTLEKLDPYLTKKTTTGDLATKFAELGENMKSADPNINPAIEVLSKNLDKFADKEGKISLQNMQKLADELGEKFDPTGKGVVNALNKEAQKIVTKEINVMGDLAAANADAKTVAEWINGKSVSNIAQNLRATSSDLKIPNAFSSTFKLVKSLATHKLAHLVTGGLVGHAAGPAGVAIGAAASAATHKIGHWIENYVSNPENASKLSKWLHGKSASPNAASFLIIDAAHAANESLTKIAPFMQQIGTRGGVTFATKDSPIKQVLGPAANGLSKDQQFAKLSSHLSQMVGNPDLKEQHLNSLVAPIADAHPGLAQQMKEDYDNKIQYLHQIMPKNPNPPQPFMKDDKWKPSAADMAEFENHLKVAQNPFVLLDKLKEGKVTAKEVATAALLNPQIMNHMRDEMALAAYSGKANLTYQQRLSASIVMGQAMDASLAKVQQLQSVYAGAPPESMPVPPGASGGKGRKGSASHLNAKEASKSAQTMSQRLMGK